MGLINSDIILTIIATEILIFGLTIIIQNIRRNKYIKLLALENTMGIRKDISKKELLSDIAPLKSVPLESFVNKPKDINSPFVEVGNPVKEELEEEELEEEEPEEVFEAPIPKKVKKVKKVTKVIKKKKSEDNYKAEFNAKLKEIKQMRKNLEDKGIDI